MNQIILNPKVELTKVKYFNKEFQVVRDDLLPGGTKQRAMGIIKNIREDEIVYCGPYNGWAQVALSIGCQLYDKKATVFMTRNDYSTNLKALAYGCNIVTMPNKTIKELQEAGSEYVKNKNAKLLPFGFDSKEFCDELYLRLIESIDLDVHFSNTIWLVAGSATLLSVLYKVFPKAKFGVVQVGKKIWPDQIQPNRTTLYIAPETFYQDARTKPPYPSVVKYDAKVWQFVMRHGCSGDLIWNVASD